MNETYIFLLNSTFFAIISVRNAWATANNASSLVWTIITFITNTNQSTWSHVWIANHTLSIVLFTQSANSYENQEYLTIERPKTIQNVASCYCDFSMSIFNSNEFFNKHLPTPGCLRQNIKSGWCFAILFSVNYVHVCQSVWKYSIF